MSTVLIGYFGVSSWEKILDYMRKATQGTDLYKYVSDFWKNETLIKSLSREYIALQAKGYTPAELKGGKDTPGTIKKWTQETEEMVLIISKKLNIPAQLVRFYFAAIYDLSKIGKIPYYVYNPKGYKESEALKKTFETEKGILDKATDITSATSKILIPLAVLASIGTGFFIYSKLK